MRLGCCWPPRRSTSVASTSPVTWSTRCRRCGRPRWQPPQRWRMATCHHLRGRARCMALRSGTGRVQVGKRWDGAMAIYTHHFPQRSRRTPPKGSEFSKGIRTQNPRRNSGWRFIVALPRWGMVTLCPTIMVQWNMDPLWRQQTRLPGPYFPVPWVWEEG